MVPYKTMIPMHIGHHMVMVNLLERACCRGSNTTHVVKKCREPELSDVGADWAEWP